MPGTAREWYGKRGVAYPMTCAISTVKRGRPEPSASVRASGVYKAGTPLAVTTKLSAVVRTMTPIMRGRCIRDQASLSGSARRLVEYLVEPAGGIPESDTPA